jgi:hypothetical protein
VIRSGVIVAILTAIYYALPLEGVDDIHTATRLVATILGLLLVMAWQVHGIMTSSTPALRAVQTVSVSFTLFLLAMATTYVLMSSAEVQSFSEPLDRTDALYFVVTVFSTVGFGDIAPVTQAARAAVTVQVVLDLLLLGIGVRVVAGAVTVRRRQTGA